MIGPHNLTSFDVETNGVVQEYALQPFRATVREAMRNNGVKQAWLTTCAMAYHDEFVPGQIEVDGHIHPDRELLRAWLVEMAERKQYIVCWNTPFDVAWLMAYGLREEVLACRWLDAMLLYRHLINAPRYLPEGNMSLGLKPTVERYMPEHAGYADEIDFADESPDGLAKLVEYNGRDSRFTLELALKFISMLSPEQLRCAVIEAQSIPLVAESYLLGVGIDDAACEALDGKLSEDIKLAFITLKMSDPNGISETVLASPMKLRDLLFNQWGLPIQNLTDAGMPSTDKEALDLLAVHDGRARHLRNYREASYNQTKFARAPRTSLAYNGDGVSRPTPRIFGTYCVPGDVEVLTRTGWEPLSSWDGGEIAQVREDLSMEFLPASRFVGPVVNTWVSVNHTRLNCMFTHGHTVPYLKQKTFKWSTMQAHELEGLQSAAYIPVAGKMQLNGSLTPDQMRVLAMVQADGYVHTRADGVRPTLKFTFKKPRKIVRCRELLTAARIEFTEYVCGAYPDRTEIKVGAKKLPPWITVENKRLGPWVLDTTSDGLRAFVDEVQHWDGSAKDGGVSYSSRVRSDVEWLATAASLCGVKASVRAQDLAGMSVCRISASSPHCVLFGKHATEVSRSTRAYCATTQTGYWLARSNGEIFVTGNTGRMSYSSKILKGKAERPTGIALHQWKRDKAFRDVILPPEGHKLIEVDFAGQEFRWMAVESNDQTMLNLCMPGEDAHSFMGARINRMAYLDLKADVLNGVAGAKDKRQLGKVGNLSCQYRTSAKTLIRVAAVGYKLALTPMESKSIVATYRTTYPGVPAYWKRAIYKAKTNGYAETLAGRRVNLGTGDTWTKDVEWGLESTAINFPIQGIGADQKYLALLVLKDYLPKVDGRFYFELHDGLFLVVPDAYADRAVIEIRTLLSNLPYKKAWGVDLPIQFPVDAKIGDSWGGLKEVK